MKSQEKKKAIQLRKQGIAMGDIAARLGVAKSSVSYWVRDVSLTKKQQAALCKRSHTAQAVEKRRAARLQRTDAHRTRLREQAMQEAKQRIHDPLWCVGVALYWGEGGKTQQTVRLSNSDPNVIMTMMQFFRVTCEVPEHKLRGHIHTFNNTNAEKAVEYWSQVSGISAEKFYKTYIKKSSASLNKRKTLPYGTFQIYVHDSDFFFRLMAWIEFLKRVEYLQKI